MNLEPGHRLAGGERSAYVVSGPGWASGRHAFQRARKVFWNYRDRDRSLYEAGEDEWLGVLVRVPLGEVRTAPGSALPLAGLPGLAWPIDLVEAPGGGPTPAVLADPHGEPLATARDRAPLPHLHRLAREALILLDALHRAGLSAGGLDPWEIVLDPSGRWTLLVADLARPVEGPEAIEADLRSWADLCRPILDRGAPEGWLADRLGRLAAGPVSAAELLGEPGRSRSGLASLGRALGDRVRRLWGP